MCINDKKCKHVFHENFTRIRFLLSVSNYILARCLDHRDKKSHMDQFAKTWIYFYKLRVVSIVYRRDFTTENYDEKFTIYKFSVNTRFPYIFHLSVSIEEIFTNLSEYDEKFIT